MEAPVCEQDSPSNEMSADNDDVNGGKTAETR